MQYGLIGEHLGHSFSPQIHALLGDYSYDLCEFSPEKLDYFMKNSDFKGINVTIPYKKAIIKYCSELSPEAQKIGSVNTVIRQKDGTFYGANTDYFGMQKMLELSGISLQGKRVLILGSGGASLTAKALAVDLGCAAVKICSRNAKSGDVTYSALGNAINSQIIINTTPVGMFPNCGKAPINLADFRQLMGVADLVYNPNLTALLLQAKRLGIPFAGGLSMLVFQAEKASSLFRGLPINCKKSAEILQKLAHDFANIILIGMPGCGKTTVGKALAARLGRDFIDLDTEIERREKMGIPQIFAQYGEEYFRQVESRIISEIGNLHGKVIATGGGCVTRDENYSPLAQNGIIFKLNMPVSMLETQNRPLSKSIEALQKMELERLPLYNKFADFSLDNSGLLAETVENIEVKFYENSCY